MTADQRIEPKIFNTGYRVLRSNPQQNQSRKSYTAYSIKPKVTTLQSVPRMTEAKRENVIPTGKTRPKILIKKKQQQRCRRQQLPPTPREKMIYKLKK